MNWIDKYEAEQQKKAAAERRAALIGLILFPVSVVSGVAIACFFALPALAILRWWAKVMGVLE